MMIGHNAPRDQRASAGNSPTRRRRHPDTTGTPRTPAPIAAARCPAGLAREVEAYAELVADGRTPGDELRARVAATTPLAALEEYARA